MTLIQRISEAIWSDDTDDSERLRSAYEAAPPETQAVIDDCFISLCGYSLRTLIHQ